MASPQEMEPKEALGPGDPPATVPDHRGSTGPDPLLRSLGSALPRLVLQSLAVGVVALVATFLISPTFTAKTIFIAPQGQQGAGAALLASLGPLSGLTGLASGLRTPGDQYVALLQSQNVTDRILDRFGLEQVYGEDYRSLARRELARNSRIVLGKKDGMISIEVDDKDPQRAADIANQYVVELNRLSAELALTEAQQRRVFYEARLKETGDRLRDAQQALQGSGFDNQSIKAEPKATAEAFAKLRAEVTAAEVRLVGLRRKLTDAAPEVQTQTAIVSALRAQLGRIETPNLEPRSTDYIGKYREYKYQETLFELFSRQYELARLDEARDSTLIQVVDVATKPDRKSAPKRGLIAVLITLAAFSFLAGTWLHKHRARTI